MFKINVIVVLVAVISLCSIKADRDWSPDEKPEKWNNYAKDKIQQVLNRRLNGNVAKNLILFLGDGMGLPTVTAGRIFKGQKRGNNGEEEVTVLESLDHVGLSKTYNIDAQTADSAGTATAYLTGVKTRIGVIGLDGSATDCPTSLNAKVDSILKWAHAAGKSTGIVTTTRITHATPAGAYAHVYDREWETFDGKKFNQALKDQGCSDIAAQLVDDNSFINVIFAGGRGKLMRINDSDYFDNTLKGERKDNRNLIDEWNQKMESKKLKHKFVWNLTDFNSLKPNQYDHILGLLSHSHMDYEVLRNPAVQPSIVNMTTKAIELLNTNPNGYFLLVEGGNIDNAHHYSYAHKALDEFVAFDSAIGEGLRYTSPEDTLIVATADHSHVFSFGGYALRGNDIIGLSLNKWSNVSERENLTYTSILYGNGPGNLKIKRDYNLTNEKAREVEYQQESAVYLEQETHGGEDVAIYAKGPMSYMFEGTVEQNYIAHAMAYSACIGPYSSAKYPNCAKERGVVFKPNSSSSNSINLSIYTLLAVLVYFFKVSTM